MHIEITHGEYVSLIAARRVIDSVISAYEGARNAQAGGQLTAPRAGGQIPWGYKRAGGQLVEYVWRKEALEKAKQLRDQQNSVRTIARFLSIYCPISHETVRKLLKNG